MIVPPSLWVCALKALQNSMMLTPCWPSAGPTGGAGVAAPALIWSLLIAESFRFLVVIRTSLFSSRESDLRDLAERQLAGGFAAEDGHEHLELLSVDIDLVDRGRKRGER